METSTPLIYTSEGNVPIESLQYMEKWEIDDDFIMFKEFWYNSAGVLVKNNVHAYAKKGLPAIGAQQAQIG